MKTPPLSSPLTLEYLLRYCEMLRHRLETIAPGQSIAPGDYLIFQDDDGSLKIKDPDGGETTLIRKT